MICGKKKGNTMDQWMRKGKDKMAGYTYGIEIG